MAGGETCVTEGPEGGVAPWRRTHCSSYPVKEKGKERGLGTWAELQGHVELPLHDTHLVPPFQCPVWLCARVGVSNIMNREGAWGSMNGLLPSCSTASPGRPPQASGGWRFFGQVDIDGKQRHSKPEGIGTIRPQQAEG